MKDIISIETGINTIFPKACYPITGTIELFDEDISITGEFIIHRAKNIIYFQINPSNIFHLYSGDLINIKYNLHPDPKMIKYLDNSICVDGLTNITISGIGHVSGDLTIYLEQNNDNSQITGEIIPLFDENHNFSITIK